MTASVESTFEIRERLLADDTEGAARSLKAIVSDEFGLEVADVKFTFGQYSLNSLNGTIRLSSGQEYFFKFHTEEGEQDSVDEYYRAELLANHGIDTDVPAFSCPTPGRQILLYHLRDDVSLADACLDLEQGGTRYRANRLIEAQQALDENVLSVAIETLSEPNSRSANEPIHQLFYNRLVDEAGADQLGGRYRSFYQNQVVQIGATQLDWSQFENLRWEINGVAYEHSLLELFERAKYRLDPSRLATMAVIVSHGDAHNANVWLEQQPSGDRLVMFDPAFAGADIPFLLGEIKPTFHNIFAHPFWLYSPQLADRTYNVEVSATDSTIHVTHDWRLGELRSAFLSSKTERFWQPLLAKAGKGLPPDWEAIIRSALFCCPTLVTNLLPDVEPWNRTNPISALSFAAAIMVGSPPIEGQDDIVSQWFTQLAEGLARP